MTVDNLAHLYQRVRGATSALAAPLSAEDQMVQSMALTSPTKWHLAHTTWFFETFVLLPHVPGYRPVFADADKLFNSYYETLGAPPDRRLRGSLSRPSAAEITDYRRRVDEQVVAALATRAQELSELIILGVNHEEQHQELILTDIKHAFSTNPLSPAYQDARQLTGGDDSPPALSFIDFEGGTFSVGHSGESFAFDNERPAHQVLLSPFRLAQRLTTCGEYLAFMEDGGYRRPELWLSDGWQAARTAGWQAPLYWDVASGLKPGERPRHLTLRGLEPVALAQPVTHVSYYEADAFARWAGGRLPREAEWERAAASIDVSRQIADAANLLESGNLHPMPMKPDNSAPRRLAQMFGDVWEWTASPYVEYPGYRRPRGALGEYNAKFMCNQLVLRGGSCVTPRRHLRSSYRNFFPPDARWQFSGIRLARD